MYFVHTVPFHVHPYRKIRNVVKLKYDFAIALLMIQRGKKQKEVIENDEKELFNLSTYYFYPGDIH